ncbi:hypothetical protein JRQ81_005975 [Phrynocephalus forsythii]|uniref:Uncharacterized protein n=1 Tax=Phrynocephalus forsythii TaxID=171643 RepID=A0A9Q0XGV9_9SAUR|nr:hypothetical protein JRQ81_005975 [Phrynocephalus forsythii]
MGGVVPTCPIGFSDKGSHETPYITVTCEISLIMWFHPLRYKRYEAKYFNPFIAANAFCFRLYHPSWRSMAGTGEVCPLAAAVSAPPPAAVTVLPMEGASVVSQALPTQPW